ncbi:hypothetical protein D9756_002179 [Leucocoprinus leucothites]|uniref:Uncharacterized protein n=1 Tax=Leucocoprinus leucothites TaxID=201217 RepID=A0A8H5GBV0_9AGAR|nr:hypothetical protein D9756_002179 [Leucoagaricus leucothites]
MAQSPSSSPPMLAGTDLRFEALHAPDEGARLTTLPTLRAEASSYAPVLSPDNDIHRSSRAISLISSPPGQTGTGTSNALNNPPSSSSQPLPRPPPRRLSKPQPLTHSDLISRITRTPAEERAQYSAIPPSARSQYMQMLLALDDIPFIYGICASAFTWILLAGFILFPGTFTNTLRKLDLGNGIGARVVNKIVNLPL